MTKAAARWVGARSLVKLLKEIDKLSKLWHPNNSMCCSSYQRTPDDSPNSGTQTAPCVGGLSSYLNTLADSKNTLALRQPHVWDFSQVTELPCVHMWGFSSHQWTLAASPYSAPRQVHKLEVSQVTKELCQLHILGSFSYNQKTVLCVGAFLNKNK